VAAAEGHEIIVRVLIEQGAGIGVRDREGKTALDIATDKCYSAITKLLKDREEGRILVCSNLDINPNPRSALHTAAVSGNLEEVLRLLESGTALGCGDQFGRTALWGAAKSGHKSIIRFLLQNGSCVNIPDCGGVRSVEIAARESHWEAVDVIWTYKPTISPECAEYLKDQPYEALESGNTQTVQKILEYGINVETTNIYGYTPLHVAANYGH
jgi:ankyrin repeat protein